ncbi:hypothetical protein MM438_15910 [Arsenicicoccus dermatophilus]|nr:hypothetical protein [Arsenicicoccus dermatophilus]MCH8614462.1 hypothetical protein [Arsenicicoccus dermatophilus]
MYVTEVSVVVPVFLTVKVYWIVSPTSVLPLLLASTTPPDTLSMVMVLVRVQVAVALDGAGHQGALGVGAVGGRVVDHLAGIGVGLGDGVGPRDAVRPGVAGRQRRGRRPAGGG